MKRFLSLIFFIISFNGFSQDRAPSLWLKYQDNFQGDILINTIRVQSPSPLYTYYCILQWNSGQEGGGYCGIQEHPDGRNFIFSLWDSNVSSDPVTSSYIHAGTQVESFGGEGTGLKSWNFDIGWNTDQWYSFVTRVWDENSHTLFGYWVFNHSSEEWYHLVTMDYPVVNVRFSSTTGSFLEDWLGNGFNTREVHHKEGWKRKTSDLSWDSFNSSLFERVSPDAGAANYIDNYDGGTVNEYYFMKSGGSVTPVTNTSPSNLSLINNNSDHGFPTVEISTLNKTISSNLMTLNWDTNVSKSPQFSYHVEIYDNSEFSGNSVIQLTNNVPHSRSADIDISSLVEGNEYYIRFYIIDIFDNQSTFVYESFFYNDADGDGVTDDIDDCPETPTGETVDANGCSDSQKDTDGDGINDDDDDDKDGDTILNDSDNCPTTANTDQADLDEDGIGDICDDDKDGDGVLNENDKCPKTSLENQVDIDGCKIFTLPVNNNKVSLNSSTCIGTSDGSIGLSVEDTSFDYSINVTGKEDPIIITGDDKTASITGLAAGAYSVCFAVIGQADYSQCFEVVIGEPKPLSAFVDVDNDKRTTSIQLAGSKSYNIDVNGERFEVKGDNFTTKLPTGLSIIKIGTDLDCQGLIEREIFISEDIFYYPNPTKGEVDVFVNGEDKGVKMSVFTTKGDLVFTRDQEILDSRKTELDLSGVPAGTYLITLEGKTVRKTFKIVRK